MPYTAPTAAELKTRYPKFASVADAVVEANIVDANRSVDESWLEADYQPAIMALAAHLLTTEGYGDTVDAQLAGIKSLTVGPLSLTRATGAADASTYASTVYGQRFLALLRQNHPSMVAVPARAV